MQVIIHSIYVSEEYFPSSGWELVNTNIRSWQPSQLRNFAISLSIDLGEKGRSKDQGSDKFGLLVATPSALAKLPCQEGVIVDRPILIIEEYNWSKIWSNVEGKVEKCSGSTWNECGALLSRYFQWEYDDYKAF